MDQIHWGACENTEISWEPKWFTDSFQHIHWFVARMASFNFEHVNERRLLKAKDLTLRLA